MIIFEFTDKFARKIRLSDGRLEHILSRIEMKGQEKRQN